jgi:hypothetical protein
MTNFASSPAASFTVAHLTQNSSFSTELSFSAGYQEDSLFSSYATGPLLSVGYTSDLSAGISIGKQLSRGWSVTGFAELGGGIVGNNPDSLVTFGPVVHASAGIAAAKRGVFSKSDRLAIYAGTRPKALSGNATIRLPVSRDVQGNIHYQNVQANLADSSIPFRAGVAYGTALPSDFSLLFNLNADFDVPAGSAAGTASLRLNKQF